MKKDDDEPQDDPTNNSAQSKSPEERFMEIMSSFSESDQDILKEVFGKKPLNRKRIEQYCKRHFAIEPDELSVTYPDDKDLLLFFKSIIKGSDSTEYMNQTDDCLVDNYELTERNKVALADANLQEQRREKHKLGNLLKRPDDETLPEGLPLTWEDTMREIREGMNWDDDDDEESKYE